MINQELPDSKVEQTLNEQAELENAESLDLQNVQNENVDSHEDIEKQNEEQIKTVLLGFLQEETLFDKALEGSSLLELALLMEVIANHDNIRLNSTRIGILKKTFDEKYQQELASIKNELESNTESAKKHKQIFETYANRFSVALAKFNKRRNEYEKQLEAIKASNTQKKKELLEKLIQIVNEDRFDAIEEVRAIQTEWKNIGNLLLEDSENLLSKYKAYIDDFYNKRAAFKDLLELDLQNNLKEKETLIESILALTPSDDELKEKDGSFWKEASEKVKIYQEEWKITGNVPVEQREAINAKYKEVVENFYNQRKKYYEILDGQRLINQKLKLDLLDKIKPFAEFYVEDAVKWKEKTEELKEYQAKWREIGPAPSSEEAALWEQFKNYVSAFYANKTSYFAKVEQERQSLLKKKLELCEKAEEIAKSDDIKNGFFAIRELKKQWKEIQDLPHVDYYRVLRRFRKACEAFFKKREEVLGSIKKQEEQNLEAKKDIITKIIEYANLDNPSEVVEEVRALQEQWKSLGPVPFQWRESIFKEYREACDLFYKNLRSLPKSFSTTPPTKPNKYPTENKDSQKKNFDDIKRIRAKILKLQEEIEQYENNIQFFAKGKAADKIREEYNQKIEEAKAKKKELEQKLKELVEGRENSTEQDTNKV